MEPRSAPQDPAPQVPAQGRGDGSPGVPWRFLAAATTVAGLLSGLRILFVYGGRVSALEALTSGLMDWWLWLPLAPLVALSARRLDPGGGRPARRLAAHLPLAVAVSFAQLTLFSLLSGAWRALRFDLPFQLHLASPVMWMLLPGALTYWALAGGWWAWRGRAALAAERARAARLAADAERLRAATPAREPVVFRSGSGSVLVRPEEVRWVAAAGNYLELHVEGATHLVRETLKAAHERLGPARFLRIHRSTLVHRDAVAAVARREGAAEVALRDGTRLPVGRRYRAALDAVLERSPGDGRSSPPAGRSSRAG